MKKELVLKKHYVPMKVRLSIIKARRGLSSNEKAALKSFDLDCVLYLFEGRDVLERVVFMSSQGKYLEDAKAWCSQWVGAEGLELKVERF